MERKFLDTFKNIKVLIAEDNISQRDKLEEIISLFTDNIICAIDGIEALELYQKHLPNLVITDIKMPKLDGLSLVEKIREIDKKVPITVLTAHTDKPFLLKSVPLHLVNYLVKPITQENLIETLKESLKLIEEYSLLEVKFLDGYVFDIAQKCSFKDGEKIKLTKKEVSFIELLLKNKNQVVTKEKIEELIWSDGIMTTAALKNFIFKLRKKIGYDSIVTVSTDGFLLQTL